MSENHKKWLLIAISGLALAAALAAAGLYALTFTSETTLVEATGRNNADFAVYYFENEFFAENPVPRDLSFLWHFTNFIAFYSGFTADFSDEFDIHYEYVARKRFVITHGTGNSVIYERSFELSRVNGNIFGDRLAFDSGGSRGSPGGTYFINPGDYLEMFHEFLEYHDRHMGIEEGSPTFRQFSAEFFIEFVYSVTALPIGISETSVRGFQMPVGGDVFTITETGTPGFTSSVTVTHGGGEVNMAIVMVLVLAVAAGGLGLYLGISRLNANPNKYRQKADTILKKYAGEIIVSKTTPLDLSAYTVMKVEEFEEILKLSINLNKHIMCFYDTDKAEFCTIVDNYAYYYEIDFFADYLQEPVREYAGRYAAKEIDMPTVDEIFDRI